MEQLQKQLKEKAILQISQQHRALLESAVSTALQVCQAMWHYKQGAKESSHTKRQSWTEGLACSI